MDDEPSQSDGFMAMNEIMMPFIEWAEGQRKMMMDRGWSKDAAEKYAMTLLCEQVQSTYKSWRGSA